MERGGGGEAVGGIHDKNLLACQAGLPTHLRKVKRVEYLKRQLGERDHE